MNDTKFSRTFLCLLLLLGASGFALNANAQSYIGEAFVCDYVDGKGLDDVLKARDYYVGQAEKAGITPPPAWVWSPIKVSQGAPDLLWFNYYQNATQYGEVTDAMAAASEMDNVNARFEQAITCRSGLFNQTELVDGGELQPTGQPGYTVSSACNFRSGSFDAEALADLTGHLSGVLGNSDAHKAYILFQRQSITRSLDSPDVRFYSVHESASAWGARQDAFPSVEGAQALGRHFRSVLDCSQSHWATQRVVGQPGG